MWSRILLVVLYIAGLTNIENVSLQNVCPMVFCIIYDFQ
jgi:hypothetical protein